MKLRYYVVFRVIMIIPTLLILLTTVFFLMHVIPGDPVRIMFGEEMPEDAIEEMRHQLGLDRPIYIQYVNYMTKFFQGDLGVSWLFKVPVIHKVKEVYPTTLEIAIGGLILAASMGVPIGILAALKRGTKIDHTIRILTLYLYSNPGFWLALLLQLLFGVLLGLLPISGRSPVTSTLHRVTGLLIIDSIIALDFRAFIENLRYLILPCLTIGITSIPMLSRLSRAAMLNELGEDYIITARAKGLPERVVVYKHALRNATLPIITSLGGTFIGLLGGTVITEKIFSLPGLGRLLLESLTGRDFDMIQGVVGVYAVIVVLLNTIVDLIYASADPRVKF